jgi:hypothetical protein
MKGNPPNKPTLPSPMPTIEDPAVKESFDNLNVAIVRELTRRWQTDVSYNSILLLSPGGKSYKVSVADDGTLTTTLMYNPPASP